MSVSSFEKPAWRAWGVRFLHTALALLSLLAAGRLHGQFADARTTLTILSSKIFVFELFRLHRQLWRTFGLHDIVVYAAAGMAASLTAAVLCFVGPAASPPPGVWVTDALLCQFLTTGFCLACRFRNERRHAPAPASRRKKILLYGAGRTGRSLLREIGLRWDSPYEIVGFVDDDPTLTHACIETVPVLGTGDELPRIVCLYEIEEMLVAVPRASLEDAVIAERAALAGIAARVIPSLTEWIEDSDAMEVEEEGLLGASQSLSRLAGLHGPSPGAGKADPPTPAGANTRQKKSS